MNRVRKDVVVLLLRQRRLRLALTVLIMPAGWALECTDAYDFRCHEVKR